jgi:hypothetical protein
LTAIANKVPERIVSVTYTGRSFCGRVEAKVDKQLASSLFSTSSFYKRKTEDPPNLSTRIISFECSSIAACSKGDKAVSPLFSNLLFSAVALT